MSQHTGTRQEPEEPTGSESTQPRSNQQDMSSRLFSIGGTNSHLVRNAGRSARGMPPTFSPQRPQQQRAQQPYDSPHGHQHNRHRGPHVQQQSARGYYGNHPRDPSWKAQPAHATSRDHFQQRQQQPRHADHTSARAFHHHHQPQQARLSGSFVQDIQERRPQHERDPQQDVDAEGALTKRHRSTGIRRSWDRSVNGTEATFTIMTYNLLANSLVQCNRHLYRHCRRADLEWSSRSRALLAELDGLESHTLDIYCFQELDAKDYEYLFKKKFATWGYEGVFKKRNGSKLDGCALFYRKDRVRAQSIKTVDYNHNKFITRENVGIVALFDIMQEGKAKRICVATTHILFAPKRGMMKIAQLRMLLEAAKSLIAKENMDIPIILCGDLNSVPRSAVINYLTNESIDVSTMPETHLSGQVSGLFRQGIWDNNIKQFHEAFGDTRRSTSIRKVSTSVKSAIVATGGLHAPSAHDAAEASISTGTVQSILTLGIKETTESSQVVVLGSEEMPECGPVISQPFLLESAYDINIPSLDAKDSNRGKTGQLFTTFHSGAKLICDYIFYGHLRTAAGSQNLPKLELVACLELPCRELEGGTGLPTATFGSDHLSLASKFRFTDTAHTK